MSRQRPLPVRHAVPAAQAVPARPFWAPAQDDDRWRDVVPLDEAAWLRGDPCAPAQWPVQPPVQPHWRNRKGYPMSAFGVACMRADAAHWSPGQLAAQYGMTESVVREVLGVSGDAEVREMTDAEWDRALGL